MAEKKSNFESDYLEIEPVKSEKEIAWDTQRGEINEICDSLGLGIDEGVKEAVTAFQMHKFPTSASCEGHLQEEGKEKHGHPYPWIEIYLPAPKDWEKSKGKKREKLESEWSEQNLEQQKKMMDLIGEFYNGREVPIDVRLTFDYIGKFGGFSVQSFGSNLVEFRTTPEQQKEKITIYRKEMDDFTHFLKNKFFEE